MTTTRRGALSGYVQKKIYYFYTAENSAGSMIQVPFSNRIIAPCGINCASCYAYQRTKKVCPGCWGEDQEKSYSCLVCRIKNCILLNHTKSKFCYECPKFPCTRLKQLDKRYRLKYHTSLIGNLLTIRDHGIESFLETEKEHWKCPHCGGTLCIHREGCPQCKTRRH